MLRIPYIKKGEWNKQEGDLLLGKSPSELNGCLLQVDLITHSELEHAILAVIVV